MGGGELKSILTILLAVFSVIPTILPAGFIDSYFMDGILLFFVGGFLREYREKLWNKFSSLALAGMAMALWAGAGVFTLVLSEKISIYSYNFLYERNSPVTILVAALLFVAFGQWEMKSHALVNVMAKHVFAVFLIHDNLFFSPIMWHTWFDNIHLRNSAVIVLHMLFAVGIIFAACVLTDMLREYMIENVLIGRWREAFRNSFKSRRNDE